MCGCLSLTPVPRTREPVCNPGMCSDWKLNQQPFGSQAGTQSTEPHQPGIPGVQFYNTSSVYCIVCSPSQVESSSITIYSPFTLFYFPNPSFPLVITILLWVSRSFFFFNSFISFTQLPQRPSPLTAISMFLFCLLVYFVIRFYM